MPGVGGPGSLDQLTGNLLDRLDIGHLYPKRQARIELAELDERSRPSHEFLDQREFATVAISCWYEQDDHIVADCDRRAR